MIISLQTAQVIFSSFPSHSPHAQQGVGKIAVRRGDDHAALVFFSAGMVVSFMAQITAFI
ncbi:MAG: hypothetical protein OEV28_05495 [Nitrospirota bacterium]|nr:hypothetical protein [Nitrospirota bacterium]